MWFAVVFGCKTGVHRLFGLDCLEKEGDYRPEHTVRICCCDSALISFGCVPYAFQPPAMVYFIRLGSLQGAVLHGRGLPISVFNLDDEHGVDPPDGQRKKAARFWRGIGGFQRIIQQVAEDGGQVHTADVCVVRVFNVQAGTIFWIK